MEEEFDVEGKDIEVQHRHSSEGHTTNDDVVEEADDNDGDEQSGIDSEEEYNPRLNRYKSEDESEIKETELACPRSNPHSKMHSACKGKLHT